MATGLKVPPSVDPYDADQVDLLSWMENNHRQFGDIYRASIYGGNVYVVSSPRYAEHVLRKNWQNYRKGLAIKRVALLLGRGLMVSEGELWKTQRRLIQPAFHTKVIEGLADVIISTNTDLLEKWELAAQNRQSVNVTHDISLMILKIVLSTIFGDDYQQVAQQFSILSDDSARNLHFAQTFRSLGGLIVQVATHRRKHSIASRDMLGMLMETRDKDTGQCMSNGQLVNEIMTLIVAGHETTASTLNWTWYLLAQNPETEKKLAAELSREPELRNVRDLTKFTYARQVIEEALRLYPAGWLMTRRALKDDQIGDYYVPAGTEVYLSPYIIQRHPDLWQDPDRFYPERFDLDQSPDRHPLAMLPFSAGPRNCIGEHLARLEMLIHLIMIARKLRLHALDNKPLELDLGVNLRNKHDFVMAPQLRAVKQPTTCDAYGYPVEHTLGHV